MSNERVLNLLPPGKRGTGDGFLKEVFPKVKLEEKVLTR